MIMLFSRSDSCPAQSQVYPTEADIAAVGEVWAPNSQARAPTDPDTFEARWGAGVAIEARAPPEETASVTWPANAWR
jgi:hypothetical protein